jgi:hypothetical protein
MSEEDREISLLFDKKPLFYKNLIQTYSKKITVSINSFKLSPSKLFQKITIKESEPINLSKIK